MIAPRRSFEEGHRRKFLVVVDDTEECDRAVYYAAKRAERTGGAVVLLAVVAPGEYGHWLGVDQLMRQEALAQGQALVDRYADRAASIAAITPEAIVREGAKIEEIGRLIAEDEDISILVLAAASGSNPGPLVSAIASGRAGSYPIPVTIVPGHLSDEDIDALA